MRELWGRDPELKCPNGMDAGTWSKCPGVEVPESDECGNLEQVPQSSPYYCVKVLTMFS
ncbi:hypothetical protein [Heyndrickxia sporothermodurans]|nr:hypothetical protein [Heyndrickxia sporothermodurans]MBL5770377.1 hypothetical protein [Heyndrickxia sporothermodurans]